jgi:hypothetical protein
MTRMTTPEAWLVIGAEARRPFADEAEARAYAGDWGIVKPLYLAASKEGPTRKMPERQTMDVNTQKLCADLRRGLPFRDLEDGSAGWAIDAEEAFNLMIRAADRIEVYAYLLDQASLEVAAVAEPSPSELTEIDRLVLVEIHGVLSDLLGDSDVTHIEDEAELRAEEPVQWAAMRLAQMLWKDDAGVVKPLYLGPSPPGEHDWFEYHSSRLVMTCCRNCGIIKREDGKNKPCPGVVPVGLRAEALAPYDKRTVEACAEIAEKAGAPYAVTSAMMFRATTEKIAKAIRALPTSSYPEPEGWRDIATALVKAKCYIISLGPLDDERQHALYRAVTKDLDAAIAMLPSPPSHEDWGDDR